MQEKNEGYVFKGTGLSVKEKRWGEERFNDYRANYPHLHKMSDLVMLEELVFQEALQERLKEKISDLTKKVADLSKKAESEEAKRKIDESGAIPSVMQDQLSANIDLQFRLKEKLGLFEDKKKLDAFRDFDDLKEDFKEYRKANPDLFAMTCPRCAFKFFLKRRTIDYEPLTNSWFKDKVLLNIELFEAYKSGQPLTKKKMAAVLGVSEYYIDWLDEKYFREKKEELPPETSSGPETPPFIPDNPI